MMRAKMATLGFLKVKAFGNRGHGVMFSTVS